MFGFWKHLKDICFKLFRKSQNNIYTCLILEYFLFTFGFWYIFHLQEMQQLLVFIHYNGEWTDSFTFQNFQVTGIQIPTDCTYQNLINSISDRLKVQNEENKVQINYQVKQQYSRLAIEDDSSLHTSNSSCILSVSIQFLKMIFTFL